MCHLLESIARMQINYKDTKLKTKIIYEVNFFSRNEKNIVTPIVQDITGYLDRTLYYANLFMSKPKHCHVRRGYKLYATKLIVFNN